MQPLNEESLDDRAGDADADADADAAARREQRRAVWGQVLMSVALVPFVFTAAPFSSAGVIGWIVFANGVLAHGSAALRLRPRVVSLFMVVDILSNVVCVIIVNATTHWQPGTALVTTGAVLVWAANGLWFRTRYVVAHVVGVQWSLCFLLYVYEYRLFK
jgi:arginine/ornithine N-succinyltransferase beta subunit